MEEETALKYFRIWFIEPIEKLKELPGGNGGFVAFMVGLALYERLMVAKLKLENRETNDDAIQQAMAIDLNLSDRQRRIFWDMLRNGLLHQGMPKVGKTRCFFHHQFSGYPEFRTSDNIPVICIDPWKFTDRVLKEFLQHPMLIVSSESYPLAYIGEISFERLD